MPASFDIDVILHPFLLFIQPTRKLGIYMFFGAFCTDEFDFVLCAAVKSTLRRITFSAESEANTRFVRNTNYTYCQLANSSLRC